MPLQITRLFSARGLAVIGLAAGVAGISGCKLDDALGPTSNQGIVQIINAAARYDSVDLYVDSVNAVAGLPYGQGTSVPINALTTSRIFTVVNSTDASALASSEFIVADQATYALILTQRATGAGLLVLPDTVSAPPENQIALRIVNAATSSGTVDVYVTGPDSTLVTPVAQDIPFEGVMAYRHFPVGTVRLRVTTAGTQNVLLDVDASALVAGQVRTIVVVDSDAGGLPLTWLALPDRDN